MYKKKGAVTENISAIITLIIGVGVASLVLIFIGALSGSVYNAVEEDIRSCDFNWDGNLACRQSGIMDANIADHIRRSITSGFTALETAGNYLPIIVLAVIIFIVLGLVVGMGGGARSYGGGTL